MSTSGGASAPLGDRFAVITDDDHTGIIWIVSILCFIYTIMIFLLRMEARRKNFGFDDLLAIIGTIFASVQFILIFVATGHGLGRSYALLSTPEAEKAGQFAHAGSIVLLLALGFAKCSVICLCRRLFSSHTKSHRVLCDIAMGLCIVWSIASILAIAINCSPLSLLGYNTGFCYNLLTRWTAVGITDCITEVAIVAMAFDGLWPLQMSFSRKLQAMATFILRLFLVVFAALHITTLRDATESTNVGVAITKPVIYLQIELLYSLLSASIPALNRWLRNFDTSMGSAWLQSSQSYSLGNSKSEGRSGSNAFQLQSMEKSGEHDKRNSRVFRLSKNLSKRSSAAMKSGEFVPPGPKYMASAEIYSHSPTSESQDRPASTGVNSADMIIRKDVQWHVQYEQESLHRPSR